MNGPLHRTCAVHNCIESYDSEAECGLNPPARIRRLCNPRFPFTPISVVRGKQSIIQVWSAATSSGSPGDLECRCERWLTEEERQRADRFRVATSRNQHVVGRGMARRLLADCDPPDRSAVGDTPAIDPSEIVFAYTPHGKPFVIGPRTLIRPFNVAHTDGMVLFVDGRSGWVGVDVERISRRTDVALAERYFAKPEVEYVLDQPDDDSRRRAFLRVWTLKEAFIKAIGTGLSMPLADFAFDDIDAQRPRVRMLNPALGDGENWQFVTFSPAEGYIAAVAQNEPDRSTPLDLRLRRFETLLSL